MNRVYLLLIAFCAISTAVAVPPGERSEKAEQAASSAMGSFKTPDGTSVSLFAAEPMLANPVAFCIDEQGAVYIAESYRQSRGVDDNRGRGFWLNDDLAAQTTADRLAMYEKWKDRVPGGMEWYTKYEERVVKLIDSDGDGRADKAFNFADSFNDPLDGTGAGVIALNGNVYFTCIPHLWLLKDEDGDHKAEVRESLSSGYGVRVALRGHDMHGLALGPDGKIYWSIGDRGYHVKTDSGKLLHSPGSGAVFRCNPDGSELEEFAHSLRNPQELAFDQYGNLFTGDNNSDAGDKARLVYVVEGGESGWHMSYQTLGGSYSRGPWHMDKLWHKQHKNQAAWILPPIDHITSGPSGFAYYPGLGLSPRYDNHFFLVDFRAGASNSGTWSFAVEQEGAGFKMVDPHKFWWNVVLTDVDFGYDGKMYGSDWIAGWSGPGKGRIYTLQDDEAIKNPAIAEMTKLFKAGIEKQSDEVLAKNLYHADMRVRLRSQFALASKGQASVAAFKNATTQTKNQLARLHGIWGIGQIGRKQPNVMSAITPLLKDSDAEVRSQAAKVIGEARYAASANDLLPLLKDANNRVAFFAAQALGKLQHKPAIAGIIDVLRRNADEDVFLRHAAVMGLHWMNDPNAIISYASDESRSVRLGVLLALRRFQDERITQFLSDADEALITEAARAINDLPMNTAMPALADVIKRYKTDGLDRKNHSLLRRVINANFRVGSKQNATAVAAFAANESNDGKMRLEAIAALSDWSKPSSRDRVLGYWRPLQERPQEVVASATQPLIGSLLLSKDNNVRAAATRLAGTLKLKIQSDVLVNRIANNRESLDTRLESLRALKGREGQALAKGVDIALKSNQAALRSEARDLLASIDTNQALDSLTAALTRGTTEEKQRAYATLAGIHDTRVDNLLVSHLDGLVTGDIALSLQLDLLEAARKRSAESVKKSVAAYDASLSTSDPLAKYRVSLAGGNVKRGEDLFKNHQAAQCLRCHSVKGKGGNAGPDLAKLGTQKTPEYVLESLINPNAAIAEGFGLVVLSMKDGKSVAGIIKSEPKKGQAGKIVLQTPDEKKITVNASDVVSRTPPVSPMPPMGLLLQPTQLRDVMAYLTSLK